MSNQARTHESIINGVCRSRSHDVAVRNIDLMTQGVIPALREYEAQREG